MKKIIFILLLLATYEVGLTQQKYDDGPITGGNFVVSGTWGRNNISFSFLNGTTDIANDDERNAVRQAFQLWADYANLNFTEVTSNGDIRISWQIGDHGDGNPFDGINGVLAHAFFPPPAGGTTAFAGDVHFDDAETWTMLERPVPSGQPIDLVTVAAHEIGHALGLGHSNVNCALMNAFYNGSHRYLAQDDINGIQSIYGNRTVVRTINLSCTGGTFFINNLPNGASVNWTSSNTLIATVANNNNQGIVSRVGTANGSVRITGTITLLCGTTVTEFMDINIGVSPKPGQITFPLIDPLSGKLYASVPPVVGATSYNWYMNSTLNTEWHGPSAHFAIPRGECDLEYDMSVEAINNCGTSTQSHANAYIPCDNYYTVSPNPAANDVIVSLDNNKTQSMENKTFDEVRIYDIQGNLKKYQKFNKIKIAKINIAGLTNGSYFIEIYSGTYKEQHQLLIQK
jgi:hypothetical protein